VVSAASDRPAGKGGFSLNRPHFLLAIALFLAAFMASAEEPAEDHRAWQHGIDLVRVVDKSGDKSGNQWLVVWGSAGNPPHPNLGDDWPHDVYFAFLNAPAMQEVTLDEPQVLVARPEAQEPPSTAINSAGTILMTTEDGYGGISQRAGLWDSSLRELRKYPFTIQQGGHSGHVAAMGNKFLVAYGDGWEDGGGFLDRGTGKDIFVRLVEGDGTRHRAVKVASGHRDGWPLVAGSDRNWLVIWQRYPELVLQMALINASGGVVVKKDIASGLPLRYAYDVEYSPQLSSFVVAGSSGEGGFIALANLEGNITTTQFDLPPIASESRIVLGRDDTHIIGVYPIRPHGVAVVRLSADAIELVKTIEIPYEWDYSGTTGAFVAPDRVVFITLSPSGLHLIPVTITDRLLFARSARWRTD